MSTFVVIKSYRDLPLAELAKSKLESEGITCFLHNKQFVGINWKISNAIGGVKVVVLSENKDEANQILEKDESNYLDLIDFPELEASDYCRNCHSTNLELVKLSRYSAAIILLTQLPLVFWGKYYKCKDCGARNRII